MWKVKNLMPIDGNYDGAFQQLHSIERMDNSGKTMRYSKLLATAMSVINGYNLWDIDAIMAPRAENCTHRVYPDRLGRPYLNNSEYRTYFSGLMPYFDGFTITILDSFVDEVANSVALHAKSNTTSVLGPYGNEYVVMIKITEGLDKVWEVKEFVDSEYSASFFPNLTEYIANGGPPISNA